MLLEICCKCGFVHKDDRIIVDTKPYRAYKPHYHWTPVAGELTQGDIILHATLCVACCSDSSVDWKEFFEQKARTPEKYKVKGSLNAPLPDRLLSWASELYATQVTYFQFE
jgi:hypothetical protein